MLKRLTFHRFKRFADQTFELRPWGVSLIAGGNNSGKSSILHGLAIWQFCKTALEMERGSSVLWAGASKQGLGLGDDEFSPINVPSLNHLWTNLKSRKEAEPDGYTLKIGCDWNSDHGDRRLEFGLALANDRLFVKTTESNLGAADQIPRIAYLPPFAGITDREIRLPGAIRRRRIGEGLAGAVLRNLLLDMFEHNNNERTRLRGERTKIRDLDLKRLRESNPWELLQSTLRETFSAELQITPFKEEYHSYIRVEVIKGEVTGHKLKRFRDYNKRDLMVEGSGLLQWLSVYALTVDPNIDVLLLDEPDAHLHCSLQDHLLDNLRSLALAKGKQILVATHSTEILRHAPSEEIFEVRTGRGRYLSADHQKVGLLAGLGSDYAPRIDRIRRTRRLLFVEGRSDVKLLHILAEKLGFVWPENWVEWCSTGGHKERKQVFLALKEEIPELVAISLRDRDDEPIGTVGADLADKAHTSIADFDCRKWQRRHIESYLIWPPAIAAATGLTEAEVDQKLRDNFGIAIPRDTYKCSEVPEVLLDLRGKTILKEGDHAILGQMDVSALDVANAIEPDAICDDIRTFLGLLRY
ncbi:MAG: AAA family ATPase [Proteobacteria bacterium]|nr:AAA family ATPase [Pseudomonadota bacterium]